VVVRQRTAKRILSALTKRGLIEFCADPSPGFYRLCNPDLLEGIELDLASETVEVEGDDISRLGVRGPVSSCPQRHFSGTITA